MFLSLSSLKHCVKDGGISSKNSESLDKIIYFSKSPIWSIGNLPKLDPNDTEPFVLE